MADQSSDPFADILIRSARKDDADAMYTIYRQSIVRNDEPLALLEVDAREADDLKRRRKNFTAKRLPHLVAEHLGSVIGYAYVVPFRKRPAYRFTLKHSIYIHGDYLKARVGGRLLAALIDECAAAGFRQLIGYVDATNEASLRLHERHGFKEVGRLPSVGFKFGHWTDSVLVQRPLGPGDTSAPI